MLSPRIQLLLIVLAAIVSTALVGGEPWGP
jgi:hypothetical protein